MVIGREELCLGKRLVKERLNLHLKEKRSSVSWEEISTRIYCNWVEIYISKILCQEQEVGRILLIENKWSVNVCGHDFPSPF